MMESQGNWKKRTFLFFISQCITLLVSQIVQMAIVWYVTLQTTAVRGWLLFRSALIFLSFSFHSYIASYKSRMRKRSDDPFFCLLFTKTHLGFLKQSGNSEKAKTYHIKTIQIEKTRHENHAVSFSYAAVFGIAAAICRIPA